MSTGPKKVQGRGGPGRGQGRKPYKDRNIPESVKKALVTAVEMAKKRNGRTLGDLLMASAYGEEKLTTVQLGAIKLALDYMAGKESKQEITVKHESEPAVYLPEEKPDPGKTAEVLSIVK